MTAGFVMALPWIALSWYSKSFAHVTRPDSTSTGDPVGTPGAFLDGVAHRASTLSAATMLMIGCGQIIQLRQHNGGTLDITLPEATARSFSTVFVRICAIGMPVYASLKVGGFLVALVLLLASASGLPAVVENNGPGSPVQARFGQKKLTISIAVTVMVLGLLGLNTPWDQHPFLGYVALFISVFTVRPPLLGQFGSASADLGLTSTEIPSIGSRDKKPSASLSVNSGDAVLSVISGALLAFASFFFPRTHSFGALELIFLLAVPSAFAASSVYLHPTCIRSPRKFGLAVGTGVSAVLCAPPPRDGVFIAYVARGILASVSFLAARFDDRHLRLTAHSHSHHHSHSATGSSRMTKLVLHYSEPYPLLYSILQESDSRRIFYFMRCVTIVRQGPVLLIAFASVSPAVVENNCS